MFRVLLCLFAITSTQVWGKAETVKGDGKFWAQDGDGLSFIKQQLLNEAFRDVISRELNNMSLNSEEFWTKFDQKFNEEVYFKIKENLDKKYGLASASDEDGDEIVERKKITAEQQKEYDKKLRSESLDEKRKFGGLARVIQSYSIKKITRSPQYPESRFITIEATVDRVTLNKIYYDFMREQLPKEINKLFLYTEYHLRNTSWADLGVEKETDFTSVLNDHWKKWFDENKAENMNDVELVGESLQKKVAAHFNIPIENLTKEILSEFKDSLLIKVNLFIEKLAHQELFREYEYSFEMDIVLMDLSTNTVLYKDTIEKQTKTYRDISYSDLKNVVANHVYRIPMAKFTDLKKTIGKASKVDSVDRLTVENFSNMEEVFQFMELLKNKGIKIKMNPVLKSFNSDKADVVVFYQGGNTVLNTFITSLKNFSGSNQFDFEFFPEQNNRVKLLQRKAKREKASDEVTMRRRFMLEKEKVNQ
ncbi:MAG: hypothetical protein JNM93_07485 [Bacteriovoracaceae bacterium]|nr:hypothetical protein [Bacteriovoracaceae bacterium]